MTIVDGALVGLVPDDVWRELEFAERQFLLALDDCLAGRFDLAELRRRLALRIGSRPPMDDQAFDLLLNDDAHLERIVAGDFVVLDATMSSEQVRRLAEHLLATRKEGVGRYESELRALDGPVLGRCRHGVDLDQHFCPDGCRV